MPFCFGPILITSCLRIKDTRLSTRYIFAFQENLGTRLKLKATVSLVPSPIPSFVTFIVCKKSLGTGLDYCHFSLLLQKHLGYFNHIFRFPQLQQCDQGMLLNRFLGSSLRSFYSISLASLFVQNTYLATFWHFYHKHATKHISRGRCIRSKKQQTST